MANPESTELENLVAKSYPKRLYHRTKGTVTVANKDEESKMAAKGYTSRYLHQEYPTTVYHKKRRKKEHGNSLVAEHKIVNNIEEEEALGPEWSREQPATIYTDTEGFDEIREKHVKYLQSKGFKILDIAGAQTFFSQLNEDMQREFLGQVDDWDEDNLPVDSVIKTKKKVKRVRSTEEEE